MPARPALKLGAGGTLTCDVAEPGALTSATVTIYDETNTVVVTDASATVAGSRLTYSVAGSVVDAVGQYRAAWTYTAGGVASGRQQLFDVVRVVVRPTLTAEGLFARYALLRGVTGRQTAQDAIDAAWVDVCEGVEAAGNAVNRVIDPRPLETPHAAFAAWRFATNLSASGSGSGDGWQGWAADRYGEAQSLLTGALRILDYDVDDDGAITSGEQQINRARRRLSR